jgi:hypothetical protein
VPLPALLALLVPLCRLLLHVLPQQERFLLRQCLRSRCTAHGEALLLLLARLLSLLASLWLLLLLACV